MSEVPLYETFVVRWHLPSRLSLSLCYSIARSLPRSLFLSLALALSFSFSLFVALSFSLSLSFSVSLSLFDSLSLSLSHFLSLRLSLPLYLPLSLILSLSLARSLARARPPPAPTPSFPWSCYRGTSLVGPYRRPMPRVLRGSWGGWEFSYGRSTPVPFFLESGETWKGERTLITYHGSNRGDLIFPCGPTAAKREGDIFV